MEKYKLALVNISGNIEINLKNYDTALNFFLYAKSFVIEKTLYSLKDDLINEKN